MPLTAEQVEASLQQARDFLSEGRVPVADLICQSLLTQGETGPSVILMLGRVASSLGEYGAARRYLEKCRPDFPAPTTQVLVELAHLENARRLAALISTPRERFHLIKAWGYGFTSDLDSTLGHLLVAEMAGRKPVIHWGENSLFRDANIDNAWDQFFEPVSNFKIDDLGRTEYSFYPGKWTASNLRREELNKWEGPDSKVPGVTFLNQLAIVTVADFFTSPLEIIPWFLARHPLSQPGQFTGEDIEHIYRYLIQKYLKLKPWITAAVDQFAMEHFQGRRLQAVHVRGSDKVEETPDIADQRQLVFETVQSDLTADPSLFIFLLTDDATVMQHFLTAFPGRIISTDSLRTSSLEGIHYSKSAGRSQLGFEVLRDAYLAARCDRFIGMGTTNVSNFIVHLKHWPADALRLASPLMHHQRGQLFV